MFCHLLCQRGIIDLLMTLALSFLHGLPSHPCFSVSMLLGTWPWTRRPCQLQKSTWFPPFNQGLIFQHLHLMHTSAHTLSVYRLFGELSNVDTFARANFYFLKMWHKSKFYNPTFMIVSTLNSPYLKGYRRLIIHKQANDYYSIIPTSAMTAGGKTILGKFARLFKHSVPHI